MNCNAKQKKNKRLFALKLLSFSSFDFQKIRHVSFCIEKDTIYNH